MMVNSTACFGVETVLVGTSDPEIVEFGEVRS